MSQSITSPSKVPLRVPKPVVKPRNDPDRKLPENPKFSHVKSSVHTGTHAKNLKPKVDRSHEIFKRINRTQLANFIRTQDQEEENIYELESVSEVISVVTDVERSAPPSNAEFLIIDVRDEKDYDAGHIEGAINFPGIKLRQDQLPHQAYSFRGEGKIIVIYDLDDSKVGQDTASELFQKRFDNVYLLTGGLKHFAAKFPFRIVGALPAGVIPEGSLTAAQLSQAASKASLTPSLLSGVSGAGKRASGPPSVAGSTRSGASSRALSSRSGVNQLLQQRPGGISSRSTSGAATPSGAWK